MSSPGVVGGGGVTPAPNYMRSAPFRRLRHPLDESPAWSLVGSLVWSFLAFCLALPLLLVLALLLPAAYLLRWTLLMLYWNRRRSQASSGGAESMSASESRWLGDSWQRSVVHAVLVFDTPPKVTDLRQLFLSRVLPLCPRLARRPLALPTVGHCWLPDTAFNIDNHVYAKPVTEEIVADAQLQDYVSTLVCEGLASDRPPWELQVVGRCAILRVHQSVADGAALTTLLCRCLADSAQKPRLQVQKHALGFYCDVLRACLLGPLTLLLWLLVSNSDCNLLTSHRQTVASSGSQGSRVKVTWTAAISFAKVTRVKQVTRSTVNCVLLSALSGALRCLLQSCGVRQPPDLKIVLPVDLGRCRHPSSGLGTRVAPVTLPLPVNTEGAVPRLWSTRRTLTALRRSTHPLIVYLATTLLMALLPSHTARHLLANIVENKASLQFSSQPGPPSLVQVGGCTLTSVYALLPAQSQLSVAVTAVTYNDQLSVTVATDATLGPAGNLLLHHLQAQIESLYELLKNRRAPGESKNENNLYRFPDVTRSPVREIAHRLNHVQEEVRRLSHHDAAGEPERLQRLKAEFSHLLRELRKRKSSGGSPDQDTDDWEEKLRSRRRSMSCSFARRPSATLIGLIANNRRPISCIEPTSALSPPSANRAQTRRNTTGCTQAMSSSSSSSSTSHSSNSSTCNRRTSTPLFSPVNDRQRLTDIKESPTKQRRPSDDVKRQTFVKSYSQPSVMPHDVQREISVSNTNLLKAANYHSQPVFRISEESPFVIPNKVPPNNEPYNLRRKLLERNIYPDYNSYINSRQSVVHRMEDSRKFEDRPVSSSSIYCDYDKHQNYESKHPKRTSDDPGMQAYPSKYSFDSELYDEILYVIKDNEQLSSLYSGFDSPRTVERTLRTTRIDGCDQEESVRNTNHYKSSPSPSSSQWVSSESRYHQYMSEQSFGDKELSTGKQIHHQNAGYTSSPKENYSWRSYDKRLKHDEEQLSSSSSSVSSPMRRRNRSSIFGRYRKFFNDVDDDEINDSNIELAGNHCYQQDVTSYENQGHSSPYSSQGPSRGYRDVIDHLSDFANTVHKFGSSSRVDASCGVHYNPKTQVHSASSSKSSLLSSSQSYGYSDGALKSRDVSPSSRSSPMNRSRSPLTTLCEETRLTSTLAIDDHQSGQDYNNQSGQDYFGHRGRGREFSAEDQPTRFLRDRQYDKALSYFVTQKINSANFHNRDTTYHQSSPSSSPNATCYTTRQQHPRSPLGDHHQLPHIEVLESSSAIYVPKYKQLLSSTASPKSNHTQEPSQVSINLEQGPSQSDQTTSLPIMSSSSSSSSNSIVSFMRIPFEDDAKVSNAEGANNGSSSGYRSKKTNYSYNNKAYDNGQDKVEFI